METGFYFVTKPLAWLAVIVLGLIMWWIIIRLGFRAYYKSRLEYYEERRRKKDANPEGNNAGTPGI